MDADNFACDVEHEFSLSYSVLTSTLKLLSEGHFNNNDVHSIDNVCSSAHTYGCMVDLRIAY